MNDVPAGAENQLVEVAALPTPMEIQLDSEKAVARIHSINKVIDGAVKVSLGRTNPADWVRMGGKLYCQASGIQKMRAVFGIYYRERKVTKIHNDDGSYAFTTTGIVGSKLLDGLYGETTLEIIGGRSSSDPFFSKGNKVADPLDVEKAAHANWEVRAVTALLGLGNLTEEDLKKHGMDTSKIGTVEYSKGAEGGGKEGVISEAQRKRLFAIMKDSNCPEDLLRKHLKNKFNIDSTADVQRKDYDEVVAWVQRGGVA